MQAVQQNCLSFVMESVLWESARESLQEAPGAKPDSTAPATQNGLPESPGASDSCRNFAEGHHVCQGVEIHFKLSESSVSKETQEQGRPLFCLKKASPANNETHKEESH